MSVPPFDRKQNLYQPISYRSEAESQLNHNPVKAFNDGLSTEKIIHELQVHQIELEMQNEELKRAHLELEISRDNYLDLFEFAPVGYFTLNDKGLIIEVNFAGAELLGVERKELISCPFSRFVAPEDSDQFYLRRVRLVHENGPQSYEMQIKRADSSLLYVHVDVIKIVIEGHTFNLRIALTNITESKLVESLRSTNEDLVSLIQHANGPIIVWDTSLKIININHAVIKLTGLKASELLGSSIDTLFDADNLNEVQVAIQRTMLGECWESFELPLKNLEGELRVISWNTATVYKADGKSIRSVIAQGHDITEHKKTEQDLRVAAIAFQTQEGIVVTDRNLIVIRVNNAFASMTGYSLDELVGKSATIINTDLHNHQFFESVFETINFRGFWQGEIWCKRKNNEIFPGLITITPVTNIDGFSKCYVTTLLDISLQKQAEKVLLDSRRNLEKQFERVSKELTSTKEESDEVNTALKVMVRMRQSENNDSKNLLAIELKEEVFPFLQRLKSGNKDSKQLSLIDTLEANLLRLISNYGSQTIITSSYQFLTPKEIQIATMVREGFSTKVIASALSISPETVSIHRKKIRKKLGLDSRTENLRSYLVLNIKL